MDDVRRDQVYNNLNLKETEELLEIWQERNLDAWDEEVFEIIKGILSERLGYLPSEPVEFQVNQILDRAEACLEAGELDKALSECESAIQIMPELADAYNDRGLVYDEMGQFEKALADYQTAFRLDPGFVDALDNMKSIEKNIEAKFLQSDCKQHLDQALEYSDSDEPETALEECELARQDMPAIPIAYNYLGLVLEKLGNLDSAIDAYLEAIRLNPDYDPARQNLGNARLKLEEEQYRQVAPDNGDEEQEIVLDVDESQDWETPGNEDSAPGWLYLDKKGFLLAGWPGHRTRQGRSGYDPLESDFELAHMEGVMIRWLFTRRFRTHHPVYLLLMAAIGFVYCLPLLLGGITFIQGDWASILVIIMSSPCWVIGMALLVNVYSSLGIQGFDEYGEDGSAFF